MGLAIVLYSFYSFICMLAITLSYSTGISRDNLIADDPVLYVILVYSTPMIILDIIMILKEMTRKKRATEIIKSINKKNEDADANRYLDGELNGRD
jgi:hypothetical protein